jgi:hypothetical protein
MKNYLDRLRMLPRGVRRRLMISFSLMAVIPILAGVYAITVHISNHQISEWLSLIFLTCIILASFGFVMMRAAVWSLVDISKTIEEVLPPLDNQKKASTVSDADILLFERLIVYMENQVHQARLRLEKYRKMGSQNSPFRLPPLVPPRIMRDRISRELKLAEQNKYPVSIIAVREASLSTEHIIDDSRLPLWLSDALREAGFSFDGIGLWNAGQWLLWIRKKSGADVNTIKNRIAAVLPPEQLDRVSLRVWSHPLHGFANNEILAALDAFGDQV